jgi:hypothetical protein
MKAWLVARIDQAHELMGWCVFCVASTLVCMGKIDGPTYAGLVGGAVVTVVGVKHFRGLTVGPGGLGVADKESDDDGANK